MLPYWNIVTAVAVVCNDLKYIYQKLFKEHLKVSSKDSHTLFIYLPVHLIVVFASLKGRLSF